MREQEIEWIPKDYDPGFTVEEWVELLQDKSIFTEDDLKIMKRIQDYGGQASCTELSEKYGREKNFYNVGSSKLARQIEKKTGCLRYINADRAVNWWPILYTGRKDKESGSFIWKLREELAEALNQVDLSKIPLYEEKIQAIEKKERQYWWLNANPKIWSFSHIKVGETQSYTFYNENGNQRRIFQNFLDVQPGDIVIGYESNSAKKIVALAKIVQEEENETICIEKTEMLANPIEYASLKDCTELKNMELFKNSNGTLFKLTEEEYNFIIDMIREENPLNPKKDLLRYTKEDFLADVFMPEQEYNDMESLIREKKNVIFQGAPGVGKTYAAEKLAYSMMGKKDNSRIIKVQFHQNYSYEDFIMGYRPEGNEFKLKYGIFYQFCQKAENDPDKEYFFIIDEINRGNLSKIFGELLMLIEKEYRGSKITLAYNGMPFSVPENLYIIGMMNTADRSLAMIDYALRRRFSFYEMKPAFFYESFLEYQRTLENETFDTLIEQIKRLNMEIAKDDSLGRGFQIGHSYFCGKNKENCTAQWMRLVVEFDIIPTLEEYWFDEPNKLEYWKKNLRGVLNDER